MRRLLLIAAVVLTGCMSGAPAPPDGEPAVVGVVTDITPVAAVTEDCVEPGPTDPEAPVSSTEPPICTSRGGRLATVLVEAQPGAQTGTKIVFTVTEDTTILEAVDGGTRGTAFAAVMPGVTVSAWAAGPIAESYPAQATAAAIVVEETP